VREPTILTAQINGLSFNVSPNDVYRPFWDRFSTGTWEPRTFAVFDRFLRTDRSYIDIGAWIGPTVLYGVQRARVAYALEPDPVAFAELRTNVDLNSDLRGRIRVYDQCIASESGTIELYVGGFYSDSASRLGDSMSSIVRLSAESGQISTRVKVTTLEEFIDGHGIEDCNFVKMDIEGGEFIVLPSIRNYLGRSQPTLYVSFHAPPADRREELVRESFDILHSVYSHVYETSGQPLSLMKLADSVKDWSDETPGSLWRTLDQTIGAGVVATTQCW